LTITSGFSEMQVDDKNNLEFLGTKLNVKGATGDYKLKFR